MRSGIFHITPLFDSFAALDDEELGPQNLRIPRACFLSIFSGKSTIVNICD
jgi:hypothetical protein